MTATQIAIAAARTAGIAFARELNATPREALYWSPLTAHDDLPTEDYATLRREFGTVTPAMERAYRDGFNATFDATLSHEDA